MATTPTRLRMPRSHAQQLLAVTLVLLIITCVQVCSPAAASAATAPNYVATPITHANGATLAACRGWGGDTDDAGRFYSPCLLGRDLDANGTVDVVAPALVEYGLSGVVQHIGWLPSEYSFLSPQTPGAYNTVDATVTPDGTTAYVSVGPNLDQLVRGPNVHPYTGQPLANGATAGSILRLRRQPDGTWLHDPSFRAGPFQIGAYHWSARNVDVDAAGRLYATANSIVFELSPVTGQQVNAFGGGAVTNGVGGAWIEGIDKAMGISVTADGNAMYVVDQQHQIVQRWYRSNGVNWLRDQGFLLGTPSVVGDYCASAAHFQSPYDVGHDLAGDVYVMDTTCGRVQRFTNTGAFVQTVWQDRTLADLSHGFAVSWNGSVLVPTASLLLTRQDPPARPVVGGGGGGEEPVAAPAPVPEPAKCVDRRRPTLKQVATNRRSTTRRTAITALATDDCGITHVRVRGDRTGRVAWVRGTTVTVPLKGLNGRKRLTVQVRDVRGRTSTKRIIVQLKLRQAPLKVRSRVRLAGSGCSANPLARVAGSASYRVADRCATVAGRVQRIERAGTTGRRYLVRLSARTARRVFTNAVGPVDLWVIADAGTRRQGRVIRARRTAVAVGAIIASKDRRSAFMIPVSRIRGR